MRVHRKRNSGIRAREAKMKRPPKATTREFNRIMGNTLVNARDLVMWGVDSGNTTPEEVRHTVASIREILPKLVDSGMSQRNMAKYCGVTQGTISYHLKSMRLERNSFKGEQGSVTGSAKTKAHRKAVAEQAASKGVTDAPAEKYRIVYADPAWDYGTHLQPDYHPEQRDHYPVMAIPAICALPVADWVEDDAVLFLWVTAPILEKSFHVVHAWGFDYKTCFVWDKIKHNMGHYNSVRHELLLLCTRGACQPDNKQLIDSVQTIERTEHSVKPPEFYDIIETIYTRGRRLEMFARQRRDGWDCYGHIDEIGIAAE